METLEKIFPAVRFYSALNEYIKVSLIGDIATRSFFEFACLKWPNWHCFDYILRI